MESVKLVLIRHGESEFNLNNRFCGWHDADLSEKGAYDASKISANALKEENFEFDCAYTSQLNRAKTTLNIILKDLNLSNIPITYDWRLNERHYGELTGFNKRQVADKYGERQVQIWRRSFDVKPPPIQPENPYYASILNNPNFSNIPKEYFPRTESLKTVMDRVIPMFKELIIERISCGKRVLIVAHGTIVRALAKHIENISDDNISCVNIPNSIPVVYDFDIETMQRVGKVNYLADENFLNKQMERTAAIGN